MNRPHEDGIEVAELNERGELLPSSSSTPAHVITLGYPEPHQLTRAQAWSLYASHLLSTWNARTYEFAAIIFTASAYPDTLTASAVRGIITQLSSILLSASIGRWIDSSPNRLRTLISTITANRGSVIAACVGWWFIVISGTGSAAITRDASSAAPEGSVLNKGLVFAVVLLLGVIEKSSGAANTMSMERDWVVAVANADGQAYDLTHLNAVMRRIDLICKLVAPIVISLLLSGTSSVRTGVLVVGGMSACSWGVEWWCARRVWGANDALRMPKSVSRGCEEDEVTAVVGQRESGLQRLADMTTCWLRRYARDFSAYFSTSVWIPSLALCLLHLSALSYSATFITYLLSVGFSLNVITLARAIGSVVEISSTIVTPFGVSFLGKPRHHHHLQLPSSDNEEDGEESPFANMALEEEQVPQRSYTETGLERLGLWGVTWQLLNLVPVVLTIWAMSPASSSVPATPPRSEASILLNFPLPSLLGRTASSSPLIISIILFTTLSLSRLGLWIFDLTTQQLTQTLVPPSHVASFAGVENSFVSLFELLQHVATLVLSRPEEFRYIALGSWVAVGVSSVVYAGWVRCQRGHLVHFEKMGGMCGGCGVHKH
jgi:iron-regulated transporter 1